MMYNISKLSKKMSSISGISLIECQRRYVRIAIDGLSIDVEECEYEVKNTLQDCFAESYSDGELSSDLEKELFKVKDTQKYIRRNERAIAAYKKWLNNSGR